MDTIRSLFIGPPAVDLNTFGGDKVSSAAGNKVYNVSRDAGICISITNCLDFSIIEFSFSAGNVKMNGIQISRNPDALPDGLGFVHLCPEVPFVTSAEITEALKNPQPVPKPDRSACNIRVCNK
jgi:hypothetical protein